MVKGHEKGSGAGRSSTPRIRRGKIGSVFQGSPGAQSEMGSPLRSVRLRVEPFGSCRVNGKGYPRINSGRYRDAYLHRAIWETIAGRKIPEGFAVHHMNGKLCWCPEQLVALGPGLHVHQKIRDPYTGEFMTKGAYTRRYGDLG